VGLSLLHSIARAEESMVQYFDLVIRCPACLKEDKDGGVPRQWYHSTCWGKLQIGDNAYYHCLKCGLESHVRNWRYACESHANDYRLTTSAHLASAISTAGQLTGRAGKEWLMRFLEQCDDW